MLRVRERWRLSMAVGHFPGETHDPSGVLYFVAEVVACDEPVGSVACSACLDVGGLLAGLPAAGEHDGALDGRALLTVDVLCVDQPQRVEVLASELDFAL